jgi:hypothetical protein
MPSFPCSGCLKRSRAKVEQDARGPYVVCEHCGAASDLERLPIPQGDPPLLKVTGLRGPPR